MQQQVYWGTMCDQHSQRLILDFCEAFCEQGQSKTKSVKVDLTQQASAPLECNVPQWQMMPDLVEPTGINTAFEGVSMMQMTPILRHQICGNRLDPQIYWDRLVFRPPPFWDRFLVWMTDPFRPGQLQNALQTVAWDGEQCVRCAMIPFMMQAEFDASSGPYLIKPTPPSADGSTALQFILLVRPKLRHQRALHLSLSLPEGTRRGTAIVDTIYGFTNVPAIFDIVHPVHHCRSTSWCRVSWTTPTRSFVVWWPFAFAVNDFTHIELAEINSHELPVATQIVLAGDGPRQQSCPDSGSTEYDDTTSLLTTWEKHEQSSHATVLVTMDESDVLSLMHMPRPEADRSRTNSPQSEPRETFESDDDESLHPTHSPSTDDPASAIVTYGRHIETSLISIDEDLPPDAHRLVVLKHFQIAGGTEEWNALSIHYIVPRPLDLADGVIPIMVGFFGEHDLSVAMVLIDIELHSNEPATCDNEYPDKNTLRETWEMPTRATRSVFLHTIGLTTLCNHIALPCIVLFGEHPWHSQDARPYPITDGLYLQVKIPIPNPEIPLLFYREYARAGVAFNNMLQHWNQQRAATAARMNDIFQTDDEEITRAVAETDRGEPHDFSGLFAVRTSVAMHELERTHRFASAAETDGDVTSLMARIPAIRSDRPPEPPMRQFLVIYEYDSAPVTVSVDPSLPLSRIRHAIGTLMEVDHGARDWDNFMIYPVRPRPSHLEPLTHDAYIFAMPLMIRPGNVQLLIRLQLYSPDVCQRTEEHSEIKVMFFPHFLDRESFIVNAYMRDLCLLTGTDRSDLTLAGKEWSDFESRFLYDGMYATIRCPTPITHVPLRDQIEAARQGWGYQRMLTQWVRPGETDLELSLLHIQFKVAPFRPPTAGLPPPGNGPKPDFDSLDDVQIVDDSTWEVVDWYNPEPQQISLTELLLLNSVFEPARQMGMLMG